MQNFKDNDALELKFQAAGEAPMSICGSALDEFYANGFDSSPFLLMLYDEGRIPFSNRINRDAFVDFIKQALDKFPFTGTFDTYLFILYNIYGAESEIRFYVDAAGTLAIDVEANVNSEFQFVAREFNDGAYEFFNMTDNTGDRLIFRGVAGISTEYELNLLFAEIMPAGIAPTITLGFFEISDWADDEGFYMTDDDDTGIIFVE